MRNKLLILEIFAVISSLAYTLLLTYGYVASWAFAIIGSSIYWYLCVVKRIYAESLLQVFYISTALYGWMNWQNTGGEIQQFLPWSVHLMIILSATGLVLISGFLLRRLTDAATPYIDSFTTVFSVFATILMINLFPGNWIYWIVIDAVSVYLYYNRGLYITAVLFAVYTVLAINGLMEWVN